MAFRFPTHLPCLAVSASLLVSAASAQTTLPPDETRTLGRRVANAQLTDENGGVLEIASLEGQPLLVSPIFTKCPHTCPMITTNLKQALAEVGEPGRGFNVLSLTFDTTDTAEDLRSYRRKLGLPESWKLARASSQELLPFLESIDFRFISNRDGGFTHPNLVVFLTPELRVAKYLYGVDYDADDVRAALEIAGGGGSLLDSLGPYLFLVGVLGMIVMAFVILATWAQARERARDSA